jgi:transposase
MKAYSLDLRQKIVDTYRNHEGSIRQVARRFKVARSFVQKLLKQEKQTGSIATKNYRRGVECKLSPDRGLVEQLVVEKNDATLEELCLCVEEKVGMKVSQSTMCRFLQKHNLNRKKNAAHQSS